MLSDRRRRRRARRDRHDAAGVGPAARARRSRLGCATSPRLAVPDEVLVRALLVWTGLFGAISYELFGHLHRVDRGLRRVLRPPDAARRYVSPVRPGECIVTSEAESSSTAGVHQGTRLRRGRVWRNFGRNQSCVPAAWEGPTSEEELVAIVKRAAQAGRTVKPVGSGHSYSSIACTDGHLIDLSGYKRVLAADTSTGLVTVEAGIPLHTLNDELAARGLALENLGDIDRQSIAGAVSTGTHGTGIRFGSISSTVAGMRLVIADGSVLNCTPDEHAHVWSAAQPSGWAHWVSSRL